MATLTYRDAGVDIGRGDGLVSFIKTLDSVASDRVIGGIGGFSGLYEPDLSGMAEPVLTAATDGVGTKLVIAVAAGMHDTVGLDLVAMCVNDLIVLGATPLFFLDYFATGRLDESVTRAVVGGISEGCRRGRLVLLGGETAEMPGFYDDGRYDLAGFAVGLVDRAAIIDGSAVTPGDTIIGLASSGLHSNGFSLVRKALLEVGGASLDGPSGCSERTLTEELLEPTRIYVEAVHALMGAIPIHAMAHVTGGGIASNLVRVLPEGVCATVRKGTMPRPPIYSLLGAHVTEDELYRTFNMGIGYLAVIDPGDVDRALEVLEGQGEQAAVVGHVERGTREVRLV